MMPIPAHLMQTLRQFDQTHVLTGWEQLDDSAQAGLIEQLERLNLEELQKLFAMRDQPYSLLPPPDQIAPLPVEAPESLQSSRHLGQVALARGELAVLVVAGGQGTRLGSDQPKGLFPVGPISGKSLFQLHAEKVLALSRRYGLPIPFLVMTSTATHAQTVAFFDANNYFGLFPDQVDFFQQGIMPAVDFNSGRLLLEAPGRLVLSPNGHGGALTALADTGLLQALRDRGVKHLFYFQVDNPLVQIGDPAFLGRHIEVESDVSSKVVFKDRPEEKVGVLALVQGKCKIIEYSDLPPDLMNLRDESGRLVYRAGNPAIHLFSLDFLQRITTGSERLAFHLARKKVPYWNPASGEQVTPTTENALKFELFIFDSLPLAQKTLAVSTPREDEFAPLKNATGPDSPETCRALQIDRVARLLEQVGVRVPRKASGESEFSLELSPLFALDVDELRAKVPASLEIQGPTYLS